MLISQGIWQSLLPLSRTESTLNKGDKVNQIAVSDKNFLLVATLCFVLGVFGVHRFYCSRIMSEFLMVFTIGGLGIWALVDFVIVFLASSLTLRAERLNMLDQLERERSTFPHVISQGISG